MPRDAGPLATELLIGLGRLQGAGRPREEWPGIIRLIVAARPGFAPEEQAALLTGLAEAVRGRLTPTDSGDVLSSAIGPAPENRELGDSVRELVAMMKTTASNAAATVEARSAAVGLLAFADFDQAGETLLGLVDPAQPEALASRVRSRPGAAARRSRRGGTAGVGTVRDVHALDAR